LLRTAKKKQSIIVRKKQFRSVRTYRRGMRPPHRFHHSALEFALAQNRARYAGSCGYKNSGLGFVERNWFLIRFVRERAVAELHPESKPA
jgi:hypothetical protein